MSHSRCIWYVLLVGLTCTASLADSATAQVPENPSIIYKVEQPNERLELIVNSSRRLKLDKKIPQTQVNNPEVAELRPVSPNEVLVAGKKPGVTQIILWDETDKIYTIDVVVIPDARELEMMLKVTFPQSSMKVHPLANSVVLSGYVDNPAHVSRIVQIAEDFYPKVINNITVGGVQQVLLHTKVMEVSRTKLRSVGFDFAHFGVDDFAVSSVSGLISAFDDNTVTSSASSTFDFGVLGDNSAFFGVVEALRQNNLAKVLAEPTLVTVSGRPAFFNDGGEFPVLIPAGLGTVSVQYKKFGTQVDFVPIVLGNGNIRLEVRPRVSELDSANSVNFNGTVVPGLRVREADTGVEMRAGQTLALAGLVQTRVDSVVRGVPWLSEIPYAGALFRRVSEERNEIELLILVTPELVDAMDSHEVPPCGPGEFTTSPNDWELFVRGYLEVPRCCTDGSCEACQQRGVPMQSGQQYVPNVQMMSPESVPSHSGTIHETLPTPQTESGARMMRPGSQSTTQNLQNPARSPMGPATAGRYNPNVRQTPSTSGAPNNAQSAPGLIGPTGYDVQR